MKLKTKYFSIALLTPLFLAGCSFNSKSESVQVITPDIPVVTTPVVKKITPKTTSAVNVMEAEKPKVPASDDDLSAEELEEPPTPGSEVEDKVELSPEMKRAFSPQSNEDCNGLTGQLQDICKSNRGMGEPSPLGDEFNEI